MIINTSNIGTKILLFLANPFISALVSLKNIRDGFSHITLYWWFLVFGVGFCAQNQAADSFRYVETFMIECNYDWSQYIFEIKEYLTFESNIKDIYTLSVNFFVGRFSNNYHWTYLIYATVFGFFYIKSLKIFLRNAQEINSNLLFYALLFIFCYSNPIFNINGVRFWTSAWIGVYVALSVFVEKQYKNVFLLLTMPLIHGASIIWIPILMFALVLSRFQGLTLILFVVSSFVSAVSFLNILNDYSHFLPQFMQNQIWSYTESDMAQERMSGISAYGKAYADFLMALPKYFQIFLSYLLILNRKKINENRDSKHLLTIMFALSAVTNFLSGIPSMGRFQSLVIPLFVIVWAKNYFILEKYNKYFIIVPIIYAYSLLYWYRNMTSITEFYLYIFPAPITIVNYLFL